MKILFVENAAAPQIFLSYAYIHE